MCTHDPQNCRRGFAYVLALLLLVLFSAMAAAFARTTNLNLHAGANHRHAYAAQMAAESGMSFALHTLEDCESEPTLLNLPDMMSVIRDHLAAKLPNNTVTLIEDDPQTGQERTVRVTGVELPDGSTFDYDVYISEHDGEDPDIATELLLIVTGRSGELTRTVSVCFDVDVNRQLLHYAMVSNVRLIARGNVELDGPVCSTWGRQLFPGARNKRVYPLDVQIGTAGYINGTLGTTLSYEDFAGDDDYGDYDFHDGISHSDPSVDLVSQVSYDEPPGARIDVDDFDTSPLKAMTSVVNLPEPDATGVDLNMWNLEGSRWEDHNGTDKPALGNICVPQGTNPHFKNCTFTGITYIEVDETTNNPTADNQNGVVFEDCTFEGPVITGVPKKMRWDYNSMEFRGETQFRTSMIQDALGGVTLMAPNYNVNIGGSEGGGGYGESEVVGLVVGGVVDLYNDIHVRGTVISMAELYDEHGNIIMGKGINWLTGTGVSGSNIGNLDGSSDNIRITPDPSNVVPLGVKKRYRVYPVYHTYREATVQ
jgi:hypothetical protein